MKQKWGHALPWTRLGELRWMQNAINHGCHKNCTQHNPRSIPGILQASLPMSFGLVWNNSETKPKAQLIKNRKLTIESKALTCTLHAQAENEEIIKISDIEQFDNVEYRTFETLIPAISELEKRLPSWWHSRVCTWKNSLQKWQAVALQSCSQS